MPQPSAARVARQFRRNEELRQIVREVYPRIADAFTQVLGQAPSPPKLHIEFGTEGIRPGSIAKHEPPQGGVGHSVIRVKPKATGDYLVDVVTHELIHYVLQGLVEPNQHVGEFQAIAELVGLPEKYQD